MHERIQGAKHQQEAPPALDLAQLVEKASNHPTQSCLVQRHYLHSRQERLSVSGGDYGLAARKVLSWRLSNTLGASFCVEAFEEAIAKHGKPEIMNTDQESQYTGTDWIKTLTETDINIAMPFGDFNNHLPGTDWRGRYLNNIFIERLWRALKQEAVYLHEITDGFKAKRIIDD